LDRIASRKTLVNVLGVVYIHTKTSDGGDLYLTRFAEANHEHFKVENWYERDWFNAHKIRLIGTSSVYRVPTKEVGGKSLDLVVKNCRVGEDVPIDTHTLQEFCDAEFNSPWEEFSLVMELRDNLYGPKEIRMKTQLPMAIYVPPEKMQAWQSGRSRAKINRIRAKHPGIDLDILKQYKLIYEWIRGKNLTEIFEHIKLDMPDLVYHLQTMQKQAFDDLSKKGYHMADMKPEHVIIDEEDCERIEQAGEEEAADAARTKVDMVYHLLGVGKYSVIDYELLFRTPEHEDRVKATRRHSYLDDMRDRLNPTPLPSHLNRMEIFGVPYIFGHAESTGGRMWVVGRNGRLFDYFLPERWRKTPSLSLSDDNEVYYTVTKDNIHLVWETSRVGEIPNDKKYSAEEIGRIRQYGINSPFEEFSISQSLNELEIHAAYVRAIYMTGSLKIEISADSRKYQSHREIIGPDGSPVLAAEHNYITIRGYYNGPDDWVSKQGDVLLTPMDLSKAVRKKIIDESQCKAFLQKVIARLREGGYDGSLLKSNDILLALDSKGEIVKDRTGEPDIIICNFQVIWKTDVSAR